MIEVSFKKKNFILLIDTAIELICDMSGLSAKTDRSIFLCACRGNSVTTKNEFTILCYILQ